MMSSSSVAIFSDSANIYWHGILFAFAIAAAILVSCYLREDQGGRRSDIGLAALIAFPLALLLGRVHYNFFTERAKGDFLQLGSLGKGGYGLYGAMLGVIIAIALVSYIKKIDILELLDAVSAAGAIGIAIGRAASYFSREDLGWIVEDRSMQFFPVSMMIKEDGHWHLAVFSFEVLAALITFAALLVMFRAVYTKRAAGTRPGDVTLLFALMFSSSQTLLESWRTDALFLNSLGFVRFSQALSAIVLLAALLIVCLRAMKLIGANWVGHVILWTVVAGLFAAAFVMEFRMTAGTRLPNYLVMSICMLGLCGIGAFMLIKSQRLAAKRD